MNMMEKFAEWMPKVDEFDRVFMQVFLDKINGRVLIE